MSRPHEDRERHTLVDHRPGGVPVAFTVGCWLAVGIAHVAADRSDACVSAYETLIEAARTSNVHAGPAAVFASENGRRVVTLIGVRGHAGYRQLAAAWDDHHRFAQHRAMSESAFLELCTVGTNIGGADIDPASSDAYFYERIDRPLAHVSEMLFSLSASAAFRGATILHDDGAGANATIVLLRFTDAAAYEVFRGSRGAVTALGSTHGNGETRFRMIPRKTLPLA
jgi:hypothetical protein